MDLYGYPLTDGLYNVPIGVPYLFPGLLDGEESRKKYLNSLDSDTRAYVMNQAGTNCSLSEMAECVARLHDTH